MANQIKTELFLIEPRGFCAGVKRAVEIVKICLEKHKKPIYINHDIVHNNIILSELKQKGAFFSEPISSIPENSIYIISAHGATKETIKQAKQKNLQIIDATCPLVKKLHNEAKASKLNNEHIILIGNEKHEEVIGISSEAPTTTINNTKELNKIKNIKSAKCLVQTTFLKDKADTIINKIKKTIPKLKTSSTICYATQERQNAIKQISPSVDLVLIIGSPQSNNTNMLVKTAKELDTDSFLVETTKDLNKINFSKYKKIALSAGASAPEKQFKRILSKIKEITSPYIIKNKTYKSQQIDFKIPQILK